MKVKKDNCKFNTVNWQLGILCKKKHLFCLRVLKPISALYSQESSTGSHMMCNPCTLLPTISLCDLFTKDYPNQAKSSRKKQVEIVTHRNSLINEKTEDKLSLTTDKTWTWLKQHTSNKHFQGIPSLFLNRCQEHTEITGCLKWKLISHEVS